METIEQTLSSYEKIIQSNLKVDNPILLKTGALGTIANIFANLKYDANLYYNKLVKEINPATAEDFSSLLFHSSILNYNIEFASPATFDITFIIPEIKVADNQLITYTIKRENNLVDNYGLNYTLENDINIYITGSGVTGKIYSNEGIKDLKVDKIINPNNSSTYVYLVTYEGLKQFKREFYSFEIPEYDIGQLISYTLDTIKNNLYYIKAWYKPSKTDYMNSMANYDLNVIDLYKYDSEQLLTNFNLNPLNIKYSKYLSSQYDNDLFLNIKDNTLEFTLGDGYNGQKREVGETLIIEICTTKGEEANLNSTEWIIPKVLVTTESDIRLSNNLVSIKAVSLNGGIDGISFDTNDNIKKNLLKKSRNRGALITLKDFETEYERDNGIPFIDTKYLNNKNNLFIFNIMRDFEKKIIYTNTFNIKEEDFDQNLFYPELIYNDKKLISPFLYTKRNNYYDAYLIIPEVKINLISNETNKITKISNLVDAYITYDPILQKSKIELRNYVETHTYIFRCNLFTMTLNKDNNFIQEISTLFTDKYCLIDEELTYVNGYIQGLTDIKIDILNQFVIDSEIPENTNSIEWSNLYLMNWFSDENYFQKKLKQKNFMYIDLDDYNTAIETKWVIHLPFFDKTFFIDNDKYKVFTKLDNFFQIQENSNYFPFDIDVTQSFYNTIKLEEKYSKYLININNSVLPIEPKLAIYLNIIIDKSKFNLSDYETIEEVENEIKLILVKQFSSFEGFDIKYFESYIESYILQNFNIIKNIEIANPKSLTTKLNSEIYNKMEDDLGVNLELKDIIDFVPPYFYFDFDTMYIKIILD